MKPAAREPPEDDTFTLATRNFGTVTVRRHQIITIAPGLVGFAKFRRFVLIEDYFPPPFLGLQCLDIPDLAFVVLDPVYIIPDYQLGPLDRILADLQAQSPEDLRILVILTIPPEAPRKMTANLAAPLVINHRNQRGKPVVVDHPQYSTRHRVFPD